MGKLVLKDVRCSYVFAKEPRKNVDKKTGAVTYKYGVQPIFDKKRDAKQIAKLQAEVEKVAKAEFGANVKMGMLKLPLRDGDNEKEEIEYQNCKFMNCNSNSKPKIANRFGKPATDDDMEELCYSGAYYHISVTVKSFKSDESKGVTCYLGNLMLRRDGERLDGSSTAEQDFEGMGDDVEDVEFNDDDDL